MRILRKVSLFFAFACAAVLLSGISSTAWAQTGWQGYKFDPCDTDDMAGTYGTWADRPVIVYDENQGVCWLANANLGADAHVLAKLGVKGINPNGTMDYATAVTVVAAMNADDGGKGFLGHNKWQIPVAPFQDTSCGDTGTQHASFGPGCTDSAMGNLYKVGLHMKFPNSVARDFSARIKPLYNMKLSYYWAAQNNGGTSGTDNGGQETFSFANGIQGGTTINDTYYYVLPMVPGPIGVPPYCPHDFTGVLPYTEGPAAGKAAYDCNTGYTWPINANLAAEENFGITGDVIIVDTHGTYAAPLIDHGAMLFDTATRWVESMNDHKYLTSVAWEIPPASTDLQNLFTDLNMVSGDPRMMWSGNLGPFRELQPFFYWGCQRNSPGNSQLPCAPGAAGYAPPDGVHVLQWSYNFDFGFQSTSSIIQKYFLMVYYPASVPPAPPCPEPWSCCAQPRGLWGGENCE